MTKEKCKSEAYCLASGKAVTVIYKILVARLISSWPSLILMSNGGDICSSILIVLELFEIIEANKSSPNKVAMTLYICESRMAFSSSLSPIFICIVAWPVAHTSQGFVPNDWACCRSGNNSPVWREKAEWRLCNILANIMKINLHLTSWLEIKRELESSSMYNCYNAVKASVNNLRCHQSAARNAQKKHHESKI